VPWVKDWLLFVALPVGTILIIAIVHSVLK